MLKDITIGQYIQGNSPIHRIDPRVKILVALLFIVTLFLIKGVAEYAVITLFLIAVIKMSKVPFKFIVRGLKPMLFILIFTALINIFLTPGEVLLSADLKLFTLKITKEGLITGAYMIIRLVYLVIGTSLLTLTTSPLMLTDGIEKLLKPLSKIGFPAHELAMMMSIAIRFIPTLIEETEKIMKAQQARGADFESGNLMNRAKALIPILVPLFISAFRIAHDLAMAMEARCYGCDIKRTRMNGMKLTKSDLAASILYILFLAAIILQRILM